MLVSKINNNSFGGRNLAINMTTKDGRDLSEAVREYAKTASEQAKVRAFNVFDKYMVQAADTQSKETGCLYEDFLQNLRLKFLESLEYNKNKTKRISIGITESMRFAALSDEDMTLDNIADGLFKLGISKKEDIKASKDLPNDVDNMISDEALRNSIDDTSFMDRFENAVLKMYLEGYSIYEIANYFYTNSNRVKKTLDRAKIDYALKYNLNNIKEKICDKLKSAIINNGGEISDDGKINNTEYVLKKARFIDPLMYPVVQDITDGKSFDETRKSNGKCSYNMYKSLITVIKYLENKNYDN